MLLEKQILTSPDGVIERSIKRSRGSAAPVPESTTAWVELSRCVGVCVCVCVTLCAYNCMV